MLDNLRFELKMWTIWEGIDNVFKSSVLTLFFAHMSRYQMSRFDDEFLAGTKRIKSTSLKYTKLSDMVTFLLKMQG